jgi:hypothetical protein
MRKVSVPVALLLVVASAFAGQQPKTTKDLDKQELKMIAGYAAATTKARAAYFKAPKDAAKKKAFIVAAYKEADAVYVSPALGPKDKYPRALRLYREIARTDSAQKKALERIGIIEGIYKSMGRPVPK